MSITFDPATNNLPLVYLETWRDDGVFGVCLSENGFQASSVVGGLTKEEALAVAQPLATVVLLKLLRRFDYEIETAPLQDWAKPEHCESYIANIRKQQQALQDRTWVGDGIPVRSKG